MRKSFLLIGGDLCRRVAMALDPRDWLIHALRRREDRDARIRWIQADLRIPATLQTLPRGISHVLYASAPDRRDRETYEATYPVGLHNLLDALEGSSRIERFVLVGSTVVWPAADAESAQTWVDEDTPTHADNFRSEAILQAEAELDERLPGRGVALRLGGIYGPGRMRLIDGLRKGRIVAPDGTGHWSNRIHIDDAAGACIHLLNLPRPARCYIGTDGHPAETAAFYDQLSDLLGVPRPMRRWMPPSGKRLSNARLVASGWSPSWPDALAGYRALLALQPPD